MKRMTKAAAAIVVFSALLLPGGLRARGAARAADDDRGAAAPGKPETGKRDGHEPASLYDRVREQYPPQIPPFLRAGVRKYDERGENVSVGYNRFFLLATTTTAFTAYFYPLPPAPAGRDRLEDHVAACRREVLDNHPGAEVVSSERVSADKKGQARRGVKVTFKFDAEFGPPGRVQPVLSELYVFRDGERAVKYRTTFAASDAKEERKFLEKFLADFPWPE
jgi:hypothetical protein